jgi:competence protein ComGC
MKMKSNKNKERGLTLVEVIVIIAVITFFAALLLPALNKGRGNHSRINCVSDLKQIGLAIRIFGNDHGKEFPWRVPLGKGGAEERVRTGDPSYQFLTMTNELGSPKVLACASDASVSKTGNFTGLSRKNISYFLCLEGDESSPNNLVSGDRNITGGVLMNRLYVLSTKGAKASWGKDIHQLAGNIGLSDGSVQQMTTSGVNKQLQMMTNEVIRLLVP